MAGSGVRRWPWWLAGAVVVVGGILYVRHTAVQPASAVSHRGAGGQAVAVQAASVTRGSLTTSLTLVGVVAPETQVNIAAQVSQPVVKLPVQLGQRVTKGQLLAQLDTSSLQAQLAAADASVQQAQANLAHVQQPVSPAQLAYDQANVSKAKSAMDEAKILMDDAKRTYDLNTMVTGSMQTQSEAKTTLDQAISNYQSDVKAYQVAQAQLNVDQAPPLPAVVDQAKASVAAAEAQVQAVRVQIGECTVQAPMDGTITSLPAAVGTLASPSAPLMTLQSGSSEIDVTVPQQQVNQVRVGEAATVLPGSGASAVPAHVKVVNPAGNTSTLTFPVQLVADSPSTSLLPGQSVTVRLQTGSLSNALLVPASSIQPISGQNDVYLIQSGVVHLVPVKLAAQSSTEAAIASGLSVGQQVVVGSPPYLSDGARVIVTNATGQAVGGAAGRPGGTTGRPAGARGGSGAGSGSGSRSGSGGSSRGSGSASSGHSTAS